MKNPGRTVFPACNEEKVVLHCVNVQKTAVEVSAVIQDNLLIYLLSNAGLLLVAATVLTELRPLRAILKQQERSIPNQLLLGLVFGLLSVASTYTGLSFRGAIVNTRTISTLAAGLVGGPLTGISAGISAGCTGFVTTRTALPPWPADWGQPRSVCWERYVTEDLLPESSGGTWLWWL